MSENKVMPEYIRKRFENIYKVAYDRFLLNEPTVASNFIVD